jgi:hypothetical protein
MKINRAHPNFSGYTILRRQRWWECLWSIITLRLIPRYAGYEVLRSVLEADDQTGLVIRQEENERGEPLYINTSGDVVAIDNTLMVLLLLPDLRNHFIHEFVPKTHQTYVKGLVISYTATGTEITPVTVTSPSSQDGSTIIMEGGYDG